MIRFATLLILVTLSARSVHAELQPAKHVKDMQELVDKIRAKLPEGWKIEMTPFVDGNEAKRDWETDMDPHIVVYGPKPVVAWHNRSVSFLVRNEPIPFLLKYKLGPLMNPDQWQANYLLNKKNQELRASYKQQLDHLRDEHLKPSDNDPENYHPKTDAERGLLMEYSFVWPNTRHDDLPVYSYKSLSIWSTVVEDYTFRPEEVRKDYMVVSQLITQLFQRYSPAIK